MSPSNRGEQENTPPSSPSPPRGGFQHGGKRVRNSDRSVYEMTNFSRQPHPTILKRITWQDVLGEPYLCLPEAERRRVANQIRAVARNLAQLLIVNNSTPPVYTDLETCTVAEPPWVPDFFESERDWRPSVAKIEMSTYLSTRFPEILTNVKDGNSGTTKTLLPWIPQVILQNAYQRYARGLRLFYSREVASQETYSFGDIIMGALKSFTAGNTTSYGVSSSNTVMQITSAFSGTVVEDPPGLTQVKLHEMLMVHPPKQELRLKRTLALKREEIGMGVETELSSGSLAEGYKRSCEPSVLAGSSSPGHYHGHLDSVSDISLGEGSFTPRSSFSSSSAHVKEEVEGIDPKHRPAPLWPEDPGA